MNEKSLECKGLLASPDRHNMRAALLSAPNLAVGEGIVKLTMRSCAVAVLFVFGCAFSYAHDTRTGAAQSKPRAIHLDVVVTGNKGAQIAGLPQSDFTILDNGVAQHITSFQAMAGNPESIKVVVVLDDVNMNYFRLPYEREQVRKFFRANGGRLPYPTSLAIVSDNGIVMTKGFTQDGAALSKVLNNQKFGQRAIPFSAGIHGASNRMEISLHGLHKLIATEGNLPGRKVFLWMSPGWAFFSGPQIQTSPKQQRWIFSQIQAISSELRRDQITLYGINPRGTRDPDELEDLYSAFLDPVRKYTSAQYGNLCLQAFVVHSGGLYFHLNNDIAGLMQNVLQDLNSYYRISYTPLPGEPDEYHAIQVKVGQAGLKARTTAGYYSGY